MIEKLKQFPKDYELYCCIKDDLEMKKDEIDRYCNLCGTNNHNPNNCDYVLCLPNINLVLARNLKS